MSQQQPGQDAPSLPAEEDPLPPFVANCHRIAIDGLNRAFAEARPVAILIGEGKSSVGFVIRSFLDDVNGGVVTARITEPCSRDIDGMREIVRGIGFDPKDMNLDDLEKVFRMFLSSQRTHNRRTIICIEETQDHGQWMLERIRRLVEMEIEGKFGLMILMAGRLALNDLLDEPPLNEISLKAGKRIALAPFTPAETKEYIRRRVEGAGSEIGQVFTFNAIIAIQENVPPASPHGRWQSVKRHLEMSSAPVCAAPSWRNTSCQPEKVSPSE